MRNLCITLLMAISAFPAMSQRIQRCENGLYGVAVKKNNGNIKWIVKPKYTLVEKNGNGSFSVRDKHGYWGVATATGELVIKCQHNSISGAEEAYKHYLDPRSKDYASNKSSSSVNSQNESFTLGRDYSSYIRKYVETKINIWQKKGEFEKTSDYQKRVTEATRKAMVGKLTCEVCDECLSKVQDKELRMRLGEYDADNETFLIESELGRFVLPVPIDKAPEFKQNWSKIESQNTYDIVNGRIILRSATFSLGNKVKATYSDKNHALYAQANVQYNFDPIEIPLNNEKTVSQPLISNLNLQIGKADVDINIPSTNHTNDNTFALIFANENYRNEAPVTYAQHDGEILERYLAETLGLPDKNIHLVKDATKNDMIREIDWIKNVANVYEQGLNVVVYYAGHGVPDEADGSSYLIPIDGTGQNTKTLYSLADLYNELGEINSNSTVIFIDACFSGAIRGDGMLASARGVALKAKQESPRKNMVVISAAQGDETAWPYNEKGHGLFTYFLLKKLQNSKGNVTLGQLADYLKDQVARHSIVINSKMQTPSVSVSSDLMDSWSSLKFK